MVFSSPIFLLLFLPLTFLVYYLLPKKLKNVFLLIVSLLFYAWGEPSHIILMVITTAYIWLLSLCMERALAKGNRTIAKLCLVVGLILSIGILGFYKYFGFLLDTLPFLKGLGLESITPVLPIGISFYTFQALSYLVDVYWENARAQRNWLDFTMYISFFPQLIAGPIVRYTDIAAQLKNRTHSVEKTATGVRRFCVGLAKKVLLANQIGMLWEAISQSGATSTLGAWVGAIAFSLQIYFDFSAYSDMAIGMGKMFGFEFIENFNYPYISTSITDFWRRWHISLSSWFREYVYIPLGGNRKGPARQVLNLLIVWALTGLWHGAAWQFLFWGIYYFLFLCLEKFLWGRALSRCPKVLQRAYTLIVVLLGWVLFSEESLGGALSTYSAMLGIGVPFVNNAILFQLQSYGFLLIICCVGATKLPVQFAYRLMGNRENPKWQLLWDLGAIACMLLSLAFLMGDSYNPFLYFRF